jgi:hypothetical protein
MQQTNLKSVAPLQGPFAQRSLHPFYSLWEIAWRTDVYALKPNVVTGLFPLQPTRMTRLGVFPPIG